MYKPYSYSYLMTKSKNTLIEYLRIAEHNQMVCEDTIEQQARNFKELLKKEREDTIDECLRIITECSWKDADMLEDMIKELKHENTRDN